MTWTYTASFSIPRDQVRFHLGDVDLADPKASDEEIAYALTLSSNARIAAATIADLLATRYEQAGGVTIPGISIDWTARATAMRELAKRLRIEAAGGSLAGPWAPIAAPVLEGADPTTLTAGRQDATRQPLMVESERASLADLDEEIGLPPDEHWDPDPP